jgi:hypothetical protein
LCTHTGTVGLSQLLFLPLASEILPESYYPLA